MKAKELRIGNYVNNEQRTEIIDGIDQYRVQCHLLSDKSRETLYEVPLGLIKPIPLTEEWLLKFGFEYIEEVDVFTLGDFSIRSYLRINSGWSIYWCDEANLKLSYILNDLTNLHQLQNLYFALTGEELQTTLQ
jgi:hypothetical protein